MDGRVNKWDSEKVPCDSACRLPTTGFKVSFYLTHSHIPKVLKLVLQNKACFALGLLRSAGLRLHHARREGGGRRSR